MYGGIYYRPLQQQQALLFQVLPIETVTVCPIVGKMAKVSTY